MSEVLLVCVPGVRIDDNGGLLRVVIVPRLSGHGATLDEYGILDWPTIIAAARFTISLSGVALTPDLPVRTEASSAIWREFFPPGTEVREWTGQRTYDAPTADPAANQSEMIEGAYRTAAAGMGQPDAVTSAYGALELPRSEDPTIPYDPDVAPFVPPDFHQTVAMLREHPRVMRALGLIVEVLIPRGHLPEGLTGEVSADWSAVPDGLAPVVSPRTASEVSDGRFFAASTRTHRRGVVDLTTRSEHLVPDGAGGERSVVQDDWVVTGLDVEAGVSRVRSARDALQEGEVPQLPGLRTAGLSILRRGLDEVLRERSARGRSNALNAGPPTLTADDLVLGYYLDVRRSGTSWYPLCRRTATYRVNGVTIGEAGKAEEGHIRASAVVRGSDGALRADETVARWAGWSLSVPPPAYARPAELAPPQRRVHLRYQFDWDFALDPLAGPLPPLRFSRTYDLRLRVADLAGGSLDADDPSGDDLATTGHTFARHEPVLAPEVPAPDGYVVATAPGVFADVQSVIGPGGANEILVIRSDPNADPSLPPMRNYPPNDRRRLLPPSTTETIAKRHGVLATAGPAAIDQGRRLFAPPTVQPDGGATAYSWLPDAAAEGVALVAVPAARRRRPTPVAIRVWGEDTWPNHPPKSVLLRPSSAPSVSVTVPATDRFEVLVPPAHQATLQLSSTLTEGFLDHMAAGLWIAGVDGASETAFQGRHPMITPVRPVRVVHAVRRPLGTPTGPLAVDRAPGATAAGVSGAAGNPLVGIDPDSTARVGVQAVWTEWGDTPTPVAHYEALDSIAVTVDDEGLAPIRHEFADTKHREVTYRLEAHSRFDEFFEDEPADAFLTKGSIGPVTVPSSARPMAPTIRSVVPAFGWQESRTSEQLIRTRSGRRLRVELDRPWYTTGEGEALGVVVALPRGWPGAPPVDPAHPLLYTSLFRDPIHGGVLPTSSPVVAAMVGGTEVVPEMYPVVHDQESGADVAVAPVDVWFADGRWWADVILQERFPPDIFMQTAYAPFVRLALARYQSASLPGLELSPIVTTELIPMLPDRTLVVSTSSFGPTAQLSGVGPSGATNHVEVTLESSEAAAGEGTLTGVDAEAQGAGWTPARFADGSTTLRGALGDALFVGIPSDGLGTRRWRLVVREFEEIAPLPGEAASPLTAAVSSRTVVADTVLLRGDADVGLTPLGVDA
jgi:hypothetical protein